MCTCVLNAVSLGRASKVGPVSSINATTILVLLEIATTGEKNTHLVLCCFLQMNCWDFQIRDVCECFEYTEKLACT